MNIYHILLKCISCAALGCIPINYLYATNYDGNSANTSFANCPG